MIGNTAYRNSLQGLTISSADCLDNIISSNDLIDCGNFAVNWDGDAGAAAYIDTSTTLVDCTVAVSGAQYYTPSYDSTNSYLMTKTIAAGDPGTYDLMNNNAIDDMHGLIANYTYRFEAKVYIPSAGGPELSEVRIGIAAYYGAAWNWTYSGVDVSAADTWETLEVQLALNTATTGVIVRVEIESAAADTEYIYLDNLIVHIVGHESHDGAIATYGAQYYDAGTRTYLH